MSVGKAFIHEQIIYEYMGNRFLNNSLTLNYVVKHHNVVKKRQLYTATSLIIKNTFFPDVDEITINNVKRPAEIKFLTSDFNYHNTHRVEFDKFKEQNGCIIVIKHDEIPKDFPEDYPVDVFELDKEDFVAFVRENFDRFFYRQLNSKVKNSPNRIWITSQSVNFHGKVSKKKNNANYNIDPAYKSKIWCPIYRSQINQIDIFDKVVFLRFEGVDKQHAKYNGEPNEKWILCEIYIAKVVNIESREKYYERNKLSQCTQLWKEDNKRFNHVFEFKEEKILDPKIQVNRLQNINIDILYDAYTQPGMREISYDKYIDLIENCLQITNI